MGDDGLSQMDQILEWERMQKKTFTNWANFFLGQRGLKINDLEKDLADGILLINLYEILTDTSVGRYVKTPKLSVQKIENINLVLNGIRERGIKTDVSAEDVQKGNVKMLLGLFWMMIQKLQIRKGAKKSQRSAKDDILQWVKEYLQGYPIDHIDLRAQCPECFKDGKIFSYLVHRTDKNLVDLTSLERKDNLTVLSEAFKGAGKFGVPELLDAEDLVNSNPEEQSILTYLIAFRDAVEKLHPEGEVGMDEAEALRARELEELARKKKEEVRPVVVVAAKAGTPCEICKKDLEEGEQVFVLYLNGAETSYHLACFTCEKCKQPIEKHFHRHQDKIYCVEDYHRIRKWVCMKCDRIIKSSAVSALGGLWHSKCFNCTICCQPLVSRKWFVYKDKAYCSDEEAKVAKGQLS